MLFSIYDADQSGGIDYKEFSGGVFGKAGNGGGGPRTGGFGASASSGSSPALGGGNDPEVLATKLKEKLATRGARGIIGLQRQFKIMDDDGSRSLNKYEFSKAVNDYMLGFNQGQIAALFDYFDVDSNGTISYDEFLRSIRGPMNMTRKKMVAQAFKKLDKDNNGWIDINDVRGVYKGDKHPDVKSGKKTEDQVLQEFLETFETAHAMRNNDAPNYVVTKDEFDEYYNNISASIDDDMYFMTMMNNAWKLTEESRQGMGTKGWSMDSTQPRAKQDNNIFNRPVVKSRPPGGSSGTEGIPQTATEAQILEHVQKKIAARGARGISGIGKKFKIADDNGNKSLDKEEFKKAMHDFRIGLHEKQVGIAFDIFDRDGSGEISYDEFLRAIRGEMNGQRQAIAKKAFAIMDRDKSGQLDLNDIRQTYNAKQHPDVKAGKKTEDEILNEFLDTFEDHFCDMKGHADSRDGKITMQEWLEYYNNISMSIDNDEYFALMMNNAWNLDGKRVTKKGWGGEI
jgi:Ca2+-binding EF-hand superfamily protein